MLQEKGPVVALESTIITHGMPYPRNVETALQVEREILINGGFPATIALIDGYLKVGLSNAEIDRLGKTGNQAVKTSRRDIPVVLTRNQTGSTTVAATMIIAAMAGIPIFSTGGIGGVHRGATQTMDISTDLQELARTNVAVVCAGAKSILDIGLTLEYLETQGVPVLGYQTNEFPAFFTRHSGFKLDTKVNKVTELAEIIRTKWSVGLSGGVVVANPVPIEYEASFEEIEKATKTALFMAQEQQITGKDITPFLLEKIDQLTNGKSLHANIQLVLNNARLAAKLALELT